MAKTKTAKTETKPAKKCAITRKRFLEKAGGLAMTIAGQSLAATPREFGKPGDAGRSFGYYFTGKVVVDIDGVPVQLQIGANATVVHSKEQVD